MRILSGEVIVSGHIPNRLAVVNGQGRIVSGNGIITVDNLRASVAGTTGTGALVFADNPVFSGNVGIGTVLPLARLEVNGNVIMVKDAHLAGAPNAHLELQAPFGAAIGEISLMFHQASRWWCQIRARSDGFRFTQGNNDALVPINASTVNASTVNASTVNASNIQYNTDSLLTTRLIEPESIMGTTPLTARPLFDVIRADRTAFLPAEQIIIEASTDGGVTWVDAGVSDTNKRRLFTGHRPSIPIPTIAGIKNTNCMIRVTITAMRYNVPVGTPETQKYNFWNSNNVLSTERYCTLNESWVWLNSMMDRIHCRVERANGNDSNTWILERESFMAGWPGGNYVRLSGNVFGGITSQITQAWNWRFTFRTATSANNFDNALLNTAHASGSQNIFHIKTSGTISLVHSNSLSFNDRIYSFDENQNVTFPRGITANELRINNPALTFQYIITPSAISANRTINLPLITADDTFMLLNAVQNVVGQKNFSSGALRVNNPLNSFSYGFVGGAITANRNISLPLLTDNDTLVFENHAQRLRNKTIDASENTITGLQVGKMYGQLTTKTDDVQGRTIRVIVTHTGNRTIETRFAYHTSGAAIGQINFLEKKDDVAGVWFRTTFTYSGSVLVAPSTMTSITTWTIII